MRGSVDLRFMHYVEKTPTCWLWKGAVRNKQGYGQLQVNRRPVPTHRLAYELFKGNIPDGMQVCHKCDVTNCVNPEHLWLGTPMDNMRDRDAKGRHISHSGESHWNAKLTNSQISEIRATYLDGTITQRTLASRYGVKQQQISKIVRSQRWL